MKNPPDFLRGAFRYVLRFALQEANAATAARNEQRQRSAWKLFLMAPRMLLFRKNRGGLIQRTNSRRGLHGSPGRVGPLVGQSGGSLRSSIQSSSKSSNSDRFCRQEGRTSTGESRRSRTLREPFPDHLTNFQPVMQFRFYRGRFLRNLRCARRGAAAGPSGMTVEHLRPFLDSARDSELLWELGQSFARDQVPAEILPLVRLGRITALRKPSGGIRRIVLGDVFRRLVHHSNTP